ncbi:MAG: DsbE family thiol:disulfide interchange protein [Alphaproteobacteria bacterium]|nr:DsbE family thiol:disulfide interchange protein [Alphaproteobacteria bacterium]
MGVPFSRFLPLVLFAALAGGLAYQLSADEAAKGTEEAPKARIIHADPMFGKPLPAFSAPILGKPDEKLTQAEFTGRPKLLNVMASWCGPCKMEHSILRDYAQERVIPIYGIAWKDAPEDTQRFLNSYGNIYAAVGSDEKGEASIALGLTGVPETYLISGDGKIAAIYRGALTREILESRFDPILAELRGEKVP